MTIVYLCIFAVGLLFSLCCFAMSFYTLILAIDLAKQIANRITLADIEKIVSTKIDETIMPLEPGVYMPRKDTITGETGYHKMNMDGLLDNTDTQHEAILQSLLKVTGENGQK
jgi:hypothetical protein